MPVASPARTRNRLFTVGYEGRRADELITILAQAGVATVVDVRLTPISRKPGLSKTKLSAALAEAGIRYVHLKELGNPRDNRDGFRVGDADARDRYAHVLASPEGADALRSVRTLMAHGPVALLCFEHDHTTCHRQMVADAVRKGAAAGRVIQL
ncbi:DUF488 domain-containing protein [Nocardia veterana]|uniref:DUF488 domain-containing protein n=1 Tax=Nocardia veterana TaxID=132249 RepID=A0A7X6M3Y6_9NOCA|nr:DUF488 domain-containing protein [Nocardia veterana]NKY89756.1 DUF488 domain-containing protein [Nocardia veterana]